MITVNRVLVQGGVCMKRIHKYGEFSFLRVFIVSIN